MTVGLHPDCKARLKQKLEEQLARVVVTNKKFLDRESAGALFLADEPLPKHGASIQMLESHISEWPFYDFLYGYLSRELEEHGDYDSAAPTCKLVELDRYSDVAGTAARLVELFDTLPWQYNSRLSSSHSFLRSFPNQQTDMTFQRK